MKTKKLNSWFTLGAIVGVWIGLMFLAKSMTAQVTTQPEPRPRTPPLELSEALYPIVLDTVTSSDGREHPIAYRKPKGEGPFPVVIFFHGGGSSYDAEGVANTLLGATPTRFLKKGYLIVAATRRVTYMFETENPKTFTGGLIYDSMASVSKAKTFPGADPESVIIYGGSAGGSLAIETAAYTHIAALVLGEANPTRFTGLWAKEVGRKEGRFGRTELYQDFEGYFTEDIQENLNYFFRRIEIPVLFLTGGNNGEPMPETPFFMKAVKHLGEDAKNFTYPLFTHGFYFGGGSPAPTAEQLDQIIDEVHAFILPYLKTKPMPLGSN